MPDNTIFPKRTSINFTIRNIANPKKAVDIFGYNLFPGEVKDLMELSDVSEADIRHSLIKGVLPIKIQRREIEVVSSTIDLMQFDPGQKQFLLDLGIPAYGVVPEKIIEVGDALYLKLDPIEDEDAPNGSMYINADGSLSFKDADGDFGPIGSGGGGGTVDFDSVNSALGEADTGIKFNYQRLNSIGHPIPTYNHGATTVGWTRSQFLRTLNITVTTDVAEDESDEIITLDRKRWQGVVDINKSKNVTINFPSSDLEDGDVVHVYSEAGSTCTTVKFGESDETFVPSDSTVEFIYDQDQDTWNSSFRDYDDWIKSVNKNTIQESTNFFWETANLAGNYFGDVVCMNSANIVEDIYINGSFQSWGDVVNSNGYKVFVSGDFFARNVAFDPDEGVTSQQDFQVNGDLICQEILFSVNRFNEDGESFYPSLEVGGDLIINGNLDAPGNDAAPGLAVLVAGNVTISDTIYLSGGDSHVSGLNAGEGGLFQIGGNVSLYQLESYGGDSYSLGFPGDGGSINIQGNCTGAFFLDGGDADGDEGQATTNISGSGGDIIIVGNLITNIISSTGGYCNSDSEEHYAGHGGAVQIAGSLTIRENGSLDISGGNRDGTLTAAGSIDSSAHGGNIEVGGNLHAPYCNISINGGDVSTSDFAPGDAGDSGSINIDGSFYYSIINMYGGASGYSSGGDGGELTVLGDLIGNGEYGIVAFGGNGGTSNGDGVSGRGGNGQVFNIQGNALLNLDAHGGGGFNSIDINTSGSGGGAGELNCYGQLTLFYLNMDGGNCDSVSKYDSSGNGGTINCFAGINSIGTITMTSGARSGTTDSENESSGQPGGAINVYNGDFSANTVDLSGGSNQTAFKSANGANGGNMQVLGGDIHLKGTYISNGGDCYGGTGGYGGNVTCIGSIYGQIIALNGGSAQVAPGNSAQGMKGPGGTLTLVGGVIGGVGILDGTLGTDVLETVNGIGLSGHLVITELQQTARTGSLIVPLGAPGSISIKSVTDKDTLNSGDFSTNAETESIGADLETSIFKTNGVDWYKITGTKLNPAG